MVRTNWQWWLVLSFVVLLPTKNLFNLPVGIMAIAGLIMLVRRGPELPSRRDLMLLFGVFGCIWIPMVMSLPGATNLEHSATTTLKFLRFAFMGVFMLVALRDQRARNYLLWGLFCIALFWCLDALWQLLSGKNFFGYPLQGPRLNGVFHPKYRLGVVLAALMPLYLELVRQLMRRTGAALLLATTGGSGHNSERQPGRLDHAYFGTVSLRALSSRFGRQSSSFFSSWSHRLGVGGRVDGAGDQSLSPYRKSRQGGA